MADGNIIAEMEQRTLADVNSMDKRLTLATLFYPFVSLPDYEQMFISAPN